MGRFQFRPSAAFGRVPFEAPAEWAAVNLNIGDWQPLEQVAVRNASYFTALILSRDDARFESALFRRSEIREMPVEIPCRGMPTARWVPETATMQVNPLKAYAYFEVTAAIVHELEKAKLGPVAPGFESQLQLERRACGATRSILESALHLLEHAPRSSRTDLVRWQTCMEAAIASESLKQAAYAVQKEVLLDLLSTARLLSDEGRLRAGSDVDEAFMRAAAAVREFIGTPPLQNGWLRRIKIFDSSATDFAREEKFRALGERLQVWRPFLDDLYEAHERFSRANQALKLLDDKTAA